MIRNELDSRHILYSTFSLKVEGREFDVMMLLMRTTLSIPDDAYVAVRSLSEFQKISLGEAAGVLIRRGLNPAPAVDASKAFPCFILPEDSEAITLEQTLEAEEEW